MKHFPIQMDNQLNFQIFIKQVHHLILFQFVMSLVLNYELEIPLNFLVEDLGYFLVD
jgi:hypothetical protein